jgi:probable H4MPT-linked C1 transfer pathway protein
MIGIDVGGANLKVVNEAGAFIHYCPLFEGAQVASFLEKYLSSPAEPAAVVMSGELADCFSDKMEGISFIVKEVRKVFPRARFYGTDAAFHDAAAPALAAANWLASADCLRLRYHDAVLLDIGSTTADIIPLNRFSELIGLTDLMRLQSGYLLYSGMLRTHVATLLHDVVLDGVRTPVSTEYFATSADAHLVLGHIDSAGFTCDAADRKEKTNEASLRRLARVVCADLEEIGKGGAMQIAAQFWEKQRAAICGQVRQVERECGAGQVIVAGIGSALFAGELEGIDLAQELGPVADALSAFAVREVMRRNPGT